MGGGSRGVRVGGFGDSSGEIDPKAFGCAGAFDLAWSDVVERSGQPFNKKIIHPTGA